MTVCLDDATLWDLVEGRLDPEVLSSVDEHLDGCEECRAVVLGLAASGVRPRAGEHAETAPLPGEGAALGRFIVLERVGAGAMGVVYAAFDPELDRRVAIKLLRPEHSMNVATAKERVLREAKAMARLSHPNVVTVYEVGTWKQDVFVAMELVEGSSLRSWLAAEERSVPAIRAVLLDAGRGLAAAHDAGLVHRDFKPDNVVIGADARAQVTDFGLARGVDAALGEVDAGAHPTSVATTTTGATAGTPAYMAPEQLRGEAAHRGSDQFAFCVTAFEALFGERPFPAVTLDELSERVLEPPARVAQGRVPARLEAAVRRGLSVRAEERYADMHELLAELAEPAAVPRSSYRAWWLVAALAVGGALVLLPPGAVEPQVCTGADELVASVWGSDRGAALGRSFAAVSPELGPAAAAAVTAGLDRWAGSWVSAHESTCRATRVTGEQSEALLDVRMRCLGQRLVQAEALVTELGRGDGRGFAAAPELVAALPDVAVCADAAALSGRAPPPEDPANGERLAESERQLAVARAALVAADHLTAGAALERAFTAAERVGYAPALGEAWLLRSRLARRQGRLSSAEAHGYEALWAFEAARDDDGVARAWLGLLAVAGAGGQIEDAAQLCRHARAAVARLGDPARLEVRVLHASGVVATQLGDYEGAEELLARALSLRVAELGAEHPAVARVHTSLGNVTRLGGHSEQALEHHRRALAIDTAAFGERHPSVARHLHNIAGVLRGAGVGRLPEALEHYTRAAELWRGALGEGHPATALTHNSLGLVHHELGDLAAARRHFERSRAAFATAGHLDEALPAHNLGLLAVAEGDLRGALGHFSAAHRLFVEGLGGDALVVGRVAADHADALVALGRRAEAGEHLREALRIGRDAQDEELAARAARGLEPPVDVAAPARRRSTRRRRAEVPVVEAPASMGASSPAPSMTRPDVGTYGASPSWD